MLSRTEIDGGLVSVFDILSNAEIDDEANEDSDSLAIANREDVASLLKAPESLWYDVVDTETLDEVVKVEDVEVVSLACIEREDDKSDDDVNEFIIDWAINAVTDVDEKGV